MESKKSKRADIEQNRLTAFLIGVVVVLSLLYVLFEWNTEASSDDFESKLPEHITKELEFIPYMKEEPKTARPAPMKAEEKKAEKLNVVDDDPEELVPEEEKTAAAVTSDDDGTGTLPEQKADPVSPVELTKQQADSVFRIVEQLPEFPGGMTEFMKWLTQNLQYPEAAQKQRIQGSCVVQFIVNKDGTISDARVLRPLSKLCDAEVMRVISMMPSWTPGQIRGEPVRTQFVIPIVFRL